MKEFSYKNSIVFFIVTAGLQMNNDYWKIIGRFNVTVSIVACVLNNFIFIRK